MYRNISIFVFIDDESVIKMNINFSKTKLWMTNLWHPLTIPMGLFTAWLWSFPMYGPLLAAGGKRISGLFLTFLICHSVGLILYGFLMDYLSKKGQIDSEYELKQYIGFSFLLGFLTISFPFLPASFLIPVMMLIGLISGPLVVFFLYYFGMEVGNNYHGSNLAFIFFLAGLLSLPFSLLNLANWMFIVNGLFLCFSLLLVNKPAKNDSDSVRMEMTGVTPVYWAGLILLIIMVYVGGGLMYSLSYSKIVSGEGSFDIGFLFYTATVIPVGILADRKGRRYLINIGLSFSGLGFLVLLLSGDFFGSLALGLLQSGFAAMDIFVFLTLIDWTPHFQSRKFIGAGLFLNVITVFLSSWPLLSKKVVNLISLDYVPAAGLVLIFFIIPLLNLIKETGPQQQRLNALKNSKLNLKNFYHNYELTPREREVASLLLNGKKTSEITEELCISYNTLKTHLRNIYRKTETGGQKEFIILVWNQTK